MEPIAWKNLILDKKPYVDKVITKALDYATVCPLSSIHTSWISQRLAICRVDIVDSASNRICIFEVYIFVEDWLVTRIT